MERTMRYKRIFILILVILIAAFGILLSATYSVNSPDRLLLDFLREIPLKAQKYTMTGESDSWKVQCDRYDGVILENGQKRFLQEITLRLVFKGAPESVTENVPVNFSMEVDSILSDHLRQVAGTDTLVSDNAYRTIWYSSSGYVDNVPTDRLPRKDETLSIAITADGKTEVVVLMGS